MRDKFYFLPANIMSLVLTIIPFFRIKVWIVNSIFKQSNVDKSVTIHRNVKFITLKNLRIGSGSTINSFCLLDTRNKIEIGQKTMIGHSTKIFTLGHDYETENFDAKGGPVKIGNHVIVFPDCRIMPGVEIEDGAVILNNSVVVKNVESDKIVGGNPARVIGHRRKRHSKAFNYRSLYAL